MKNVLVICRGSEKNEMISYTGSRNAQGKIFSCSFECHLFPERSLSVAYPLPKRFLVKGHFVRERAYNLHAINESMTEISNGQNNVVKIEQK
jgi:hypothetical protein